MANPTGAFGLRPVRYLDGTPWNGGVMKCYHSASNATGLYIGDPVRLDDAAADKMSTALYQTVEKSEGTDGIIIWGVVVGIEPNPDYPNRMYLPVSTEGYVYCVRAADNLVFHIRDDGGVVPTGASFVGMNAVCIANTSGSTVTGLSGMMLDAGTTADPRVDQSYPLYIIGMANIPDNSLAINAIWEVLINTNDNATGRILGVSGA